MDNAWTAVGGVVLMIGTSFAAWLTFRAQQRKDDAGATNEQLKIYEDIKRAVLQDVYTELEREQRKSQAIDQRVHLLETQLADEQARRIGLEMQIIEERAGRVELEGWASQLEKRVLLLEDENGRLQRENDALRAENKRSGRL